MLKIFTLKVSHILNFLFVWNMCSWSKRTSWFGQRQDPAYKVILKEGILMVYKGVYGSDKGEPIWLIWLFGDLWQEGAAFWATVQVDAWDPAPSFGQIISSRSRHNLLLYPHLESSSEHGKHLPNVLAATVGGEGNPFVCVLWLQNMCQLWPAEGHIWRRHEVCYQRDFRDTRLCSIQKIIPAHRPFVSPPTSEYSFWTSAAVTHSSIFNLLHVVSKILKTCNIDS